MVGEENNNLFQQNSKNSDGKIVGLKRAKFIVNTVAYVPAHNDDDGMSDSSDEEDDNFFGDLLGKFDIENPPFRIKETKIGTRTFKGIFDGIEKCGSTRNLAKCSRHDSRVKNGFLKKLQDSGFDEQDHDYKDDIVKVSIGLNRMKSLSERKNRALWEELNSTIGEEKITVRNECFGYFWKCQWEDSYSNGVDFSIVQKFYKQLKRIDAKIAEKFRNNAESNVAVPYQQIREKAKNHKLTRKLVSEFRKSADDDDIYLCLIDSDIISFNHVLSGYLKIYNNSKISPTVMTTSYIFPEDPNFGQVFKIQSELDQRIKMETVKFLPAGVYYSEPNLCILIPNNENTVPESFLGTSLLPPYGTESPNLIKSIIETRNIPPRNLKHHFVYSSEAQIILTIPERFFQHKKRKTTALFSKEFKENSLATKLDFERFDKIQQSNTDVNLWATNLFINGAIQLRQESSKYVLQKCVELITLACKSKKFYSELDKLGQYLSSVHDIKRIKRAVRRRREILLDFKKQCFNPTSKMRFMDLLNKWKINEKISGVKAALLSRIEILILFENGILGEADFKKTLNLGIKNIRQIFCAEVIDGLRVKKFEFADILNLLKIEGCLQLSSCFDYYSISSMIDLFRENPSFIQLIVDTRNPTDAVFCNVKNITFVKCMFKFFGNDIDVQQIQKWLNSGDRKEFNFVLNQTEYCEVEQNSNLC